MNAENEKHLHTDWIKTTIIAGIIAGLDIAVFVVGILLMDKIFLGLSIAGVGIITFFGMLMISSHYAIHQPDSTGTMRKAIAGSLIIVYVMVLGLSMSGSIDVLSNELTKPLLENFSFVIITIIGFYFGTKAVTEFLKLRK